MLRHCAYVKLFALLTFLSMILFAHSAFGQSTTTRPENQQKEIAAAQSQRSSSSDNSASESKPGNKIATDDPKPNEVQEELSALKAENAAVRELLKKMEQQQKSLMDQVDRLQRRLDGAASGETQTTAQASAQAPDATLPLTTGSDAAPTSSDHTPAEPTPTAQEESKAGVYNDGFILFQTGDDAKIPF